MTTRTIQEQYSRDFTADVEYYFRFYPRKVITALSDGKIHRFNELKRDIGDISSNTLSSALSRLVSDGVVNRLVIPRVPPSVEYSLTEKGMGLLDVYNHAGEWFNRWKDM